MSDELTTDQLRGVIAHMPPGMKRAYLSLFTDVRDYAIQLVDEIKTETADGEPMTESAAIKAQVAEHLLGLLSNAALQLKGNVERP